MPLYTRSSTLDSPLADVARWHFQSSALLRLVPAWAGVEVLELPPRLEDGAIVTLRVPVPPIGRKKWISRIEDVQPGISFVDDQVSGPFRKWRHEHRLSQDDSSRCRLTDSLEFQLPHPPPIRNIGERVVERALVKTFSWRHRRTAQDVARLRDADWLQKKILLTGASGLVGSSLRTFLEVAGSEVVRLVRRAPDPTKGEFLWNPAKGEIDRAAFDGVDAVVNLSGAGIADKRWTDERKKVIRASRVESTELLARSIAELPGEKPAFICASATGLYGNRPTERCDEDASPGDSFLSRTCVDWESAAAAAVEAGARVAHLRIGVVVAFAGGAVAKLRRPVSLGLGGPVGDGRQGMSWIALDDLVGVIAQSIADDRYSGAINCVAPGVVDNRGFMKAMGRVLRRPTIAPLPGFAAKAMFGQMGEEALLQGVFAVPARLESLGFRFDFPQLEDALRFELGQMD